ncbi:MAG: TonB-dependent receptor, partial [Asticcacaulis sp.]|nr:TonB-dependent receptor [Asticcacaulis sp.]
WKPNDNTKIGLIGFYTDRNLPKTVQYFLLNGAFVGTNTANPLSTVTSNDTPAIMSDGRALLQTVTTTNYDGKSSARLYSQHQQSKGFMANLDWKNETWHLTGVLTMSEGSNSSVETELDLRTVPTLAGNGLSSTINTGFGDLSPFSQVSSPTPQQAIYALPFYDATSTGTYLAGRWNWKNTDPENLYTADGTHILNVSGSESFADNKVSAAQADLDHSVEWGPITTTTTAAASATWPTVFNRRISPRPC